MLDVPKIINSYSLRKNKMRKVDLTTITPFDDLTRPPDHSRLAEHSNSNSIVSHLSKSNQRTRKINNETIYIFDSTSSFQHVPVDTVADNPVTTQQYSDQVSRIRNPFTRDFSQDNSKSFGRAEYSRANICENVGSSSHRNTPASCALQSSQNQRTLNYSNLSSSNKKSYENEPKRVSGSEIKKIMAAEKTLDLQIKFLQEQIAKTVREYEQLEIMNEKVLQERASLEVKVHQLKRSTSSSNNRGSRTLGRSRMSRKEQERESSRTDSKPQHKKHNQQESNNIGSDFEESGIKALTEKKGENNRVKRRGNSAVTSILKKPTSKNKRGNRESVKWDNKENRIAARGEIEDENLLENYEQLSSMIDQLQSSLAMLKKRKSCLRGRPEASFF